MRVIWLWGVLLVWGIPLYGAEIDRAQVQRAEDYAESLANQLHELSRAVLARNMQAFAEHFAPGLKGEGVPRAAGELTVLNKWVGQRTTAADKRKLIRDDFVGDWSEYLSLFSAMEDVRFKVKQAHFSTGEKVRADALIYFSIVARDGQGRREWVEAKAHVDAVWDGESWLIESWRYRNYTARVARAELFSEVALSAGVYRTLPRFGTPGNQNFVAHGVAVADVNGDGWVDALSTGAAQNFLYMNEGDGTFKDRADEAGLRYTPTATGPLFLDHDNDGDVDLFLAASGFQMLFENRLSDDGIIDFIDVSQEVGVAYPAQGFSAVAADVNGDGFSDIYVASYNQYGTVMPNSWAQATNGTPNLLFVKGADGRFVEEAAQRGIADSRWSYAAAFADVDEDGDADLYVANDFGENGYYRNEGDRFVDAAVELGLTDSGNGMGVSFGDYDNDGHLDLHVTNMSSTAGNRILRRLFPERSTQLDETLVLNKLAAGNTLFRNVGDGQFEDVSAAVGPFGAGWSFGGGFVDFDNDGWQDLHAPNGFISGKSLKDT